MSVPQEAAKLPEPAAGSNPNATVVDMTPAGRIPTVANGEHLATLAEIGTMDSAFSPGTKTTVLKFVLDGQDPDRDGTLNVTPSRTAKGAFPWATVLTVLGIPFRAGEKQTITNDLLLGKKVKVFVMNEPGKKDPSRLIPRVKALLPA